MIYMHKYHFESLTKHSKQGYFEGLLESSTFIYALLNSTKTIPLIMQVPFTSSHY